jgi:hypothetical protein
MSRTINNRLVKHISILMTLLLVFGCSSAITPVQTITKDSSGKTLSSTTEYKVTLQQGSIFTGPIGSPETLTFKDLPSAQSQVASFYKMEQFNKEALNNIANSGRANDPSVWYQYFLFFNYGLEKLQPGPTETKVVTVNSPTNTQSDKQTSVQQDIASTGNTATQTPLPQSVCNMMINGQCNPNTVTAVTAVVATAVIGGITAGVVTAVNNQAQQQQQEQQKKQDLWSILATTAKGAASGPSCQCQSATIQNPPYCTGNPCSCQGGQVVC